MANGGSSRAIRLVFSYEGSQISLESTRRVEMIPLPTHSLSGYEGESGFWIEVHGRADQALYRRVLHDPVRSSREVYPEQAGDQFARVTASAPRGSFDAVVPDLPDAQAVAVFASLPEPPPPGESEEAAAARVRSGRTRPARQVARFPLPRQDGA